MSQELEDDKIIVDEDFSQFSHHTEIDHHKNIEVELFEDDPDEEYQEFDDEGFSKILLANHGYKPFNPNWASSLLGLSSNR